MTPEQQQQYLQTQQHVLQRIQKQQQINAQIQAQREAQKRLAAMKQGQDSELTKTEKAVSCKTGTSRSVFFQSPLKFGQGPLNNENYHLNTVIKQIQKKIIR